MSTHPAATAGVPALQGGIPPGSHRPSLRGLRPGILALGLVVSATAHGLVALVLLAVPMGLLEDAPRLTGIQMFLLAFGSLALAGLGVYGVHALRSAPRPMNPWSVGSAVCNASALAVNAGVAWAIATSSGSGIEALESPLRYTWVAFGFAFALAVIAAFSLLRSRTQGWALCLYGLVVPPAFAGVTWFGLIQVQTPRSSYDASIRLPIYTAIGPYAESFRNHTARVQVRADGSLLGADGRAIVDDPSDPGAGLRAYLADQAGRMYKQRAESGTPAGTLLPDGDLLILADKEASFERVLEVLRACTAPEVRIWKVVFGVQRDSDPDLGALRYVLPMGGALTSPGAEGRDKLRVRRGPEGVLTYGFGELDSDRLAELEDALEVERASGSGTVTVQMHAGATWGDAAEVLVACFELWCDEDYEEAPIEFAGWP